MVRLRNAMMIVALAVGAFGCAHGIGSPGHDYAHWSIFHCSQCDDFPMPAYGPNYSMMPGSYAGPAPESTASSRTATPTSSNAPPANEEAAVPPPDERPANPPAGPVTPPAPPPADAGMTPPAPPSAGNP
jgi:hypothetical protein